MICRFCAQKLIHTFIDLGNTPPSNSYLTEKGMGETESRYPLKVMVCNHCWLVQTVDFVGTGEMFSEDYAYFSSYSTSWLEHASSYVEDVALRFNLSRQSTVVEIAANDGYLLQYVQKKGIPCYGIEPTHSTAQAAQKKGIEIIEDFFDAAKAQELTQQGRQADLIIANNVLAHVPDINAFVRGVAILLKSNGVATFEFPHLVNLVEQCQFDTIYHEHFSYLSLTAVLAIFEANGLSAFDVDELPTHGGSLRVYAQLSQSGQHPVSETISALKAREDQLGVSSVGFYNQTQRAAEKIKVDLLDFLRDAKEQGKKVVAYGAAAKGSTLLNFAGVSSDLIQHVVDKNPAKQGKYMPGSRIPILAPENIYLHRPDYVVILPWNIAREVQDEYRSVSEWGGKFVIAVPSLMVLH